jgi:hypothetical protein
MMDSGRRRRRWWRRCAGGARPGRSTAVTAAPATVVTVDPAAVAADPACRRRRGRRCEWLEQFSAEGGTAENPSNRDWLKAKGFKTVDDLAKSYREAEHAIRNGGKFNVPGDDAKPEEVAAYHKAIGVPEKAEDYTITLPEGVKEDELDLEVLGSQGRRAQERDAGESLRRSRRRVHPEAAQRAAGLGDGRE